MRDELWFRERLVSMGYSHRTIHEYVRAWERIGDHVDLDTCTALELRSAVEANVPFTWASRKMCQSALKVYWQVTGRLGDEAVDPAPVLAIRIPRKPRFQCRAMTDEQARRLAETAMDWDQGAEGLAVLFGLYAALRRHEIAELTWDSIVDGWIHVTGKYDVVDEVPAHPAIIAKLEWWRGFEVDDPTDCRTRPGSTYIFGGRFGGHVRNATVWEWTRKVACKAEIPSLTTHQLRHTALATLNDTTGDYRMTMQFARHLDISSTIVYTRVTRSRLQGAVTRLPY